MSFAERIRHPAHAGVINPVVVVLDASETLKDDVATMFECVGEGFREAARHSEVFERVVVAVVVINRDTATALPLGPSGEPFVPVAELELPPPPEGIGVTPLHDAVELALDLIADEHERLRQQGTMRGVATLIIAGDGRPTDRDGNETDAWRGAAARVQEAHLDKSVRPVALAFGGADRTTLAALAPALVTDGEPADLADLISVMTLSIDERDFEAAIRDDILGHMS